ncbi:MAG: carbohydrate ABC transporter permease [Oscillospiraceae bacterium]|nr:carbohydrate ABC transporter permease [Oscillospiraceae bacterium]
MYKRQTKLEKVLTYIALTVIMLFFLLPLLWILRTSLITKVEAYKIPPNWMASLTFDNYISIFKDNTFGQYFFNSFFIALASTVVSVLLGAMSAYWIVRCARRSDRMKLAILVTQMIPPVVMVIPLSLIVKGLGLDDSYIALIVAYLSFNLPYVIWMLFSHYESIPRELDDACAVDGCTRAQTYFKVVLPLVMPGIMSTAVYSFIVSWNEFMFALNMTGLKTRTLPVAIASLDTQQGVMIAELCAATIVAILPVIFLSIFIKKYLVQGLTFGSVK